MFKAVGPRGAYIFDRLISSYIHREHEPLLVSSLNNSHILGLTGNGFNLACMKTKVLLRPWKLYNMIIFKKYAPLGAMALILV